MKVTFKVSGLKEIDAELAKLGRATARKHLESAFRVASAPMVADIKANTPVDTGALRDSIEVTRMPGGGRGTVGMQIGVLGEFYGHFLEFGTVKLRARPFVRPAWDRGAKALIARFRDALRKAIDGETPGVSEISTSLRAAIDDRHTFDPMLASVPKQSIKKVGAAFLGRDVSRMTTQQIVKAMRNAQREHELNEYHHKSQAKVPL